MNAGFVIAIIASGFITGALARLAIPGPDPMPAWLTLAIGLTGSIVGAVIGKAVSGNNGYVVSFLSFGVAISLVAAYRHFVQKRPVFGAGALRYPDKGIRVEQYRQRIKRFGINPDALTPDPEQIKRVRLLTALDELHHAGLIDDDELAAKRAVVESEPS